MGWGLKTGLVTEGDGLGMEMGLGREMADALWEGHTLLKTGVRTDTHTERERHAEVKTVYPPLSLRLLGGPNCVSNFCMKFVFPYSVKQ